MNNSASIFLRDVRVELPVYGAPQHHSVKQKALYVGTGGRLAKAAGEIPTVVALDQITMEIPAGTILGLQGHNGAGKTTLLRVMAGILKPIGGSVATVGKVSVFISPRIGMNPEYTGQEYIMIQSMINGVPTKTIREKTEEIIDFTELGEFINFPIRTYSAGMRTRLGFAVATAYDTEIALIDEGLGAGDAQFQEKASKRFNHWVENAGIVVLATHSQQLVANICNKTAILSRGKLQSYS